MKPFEISPERYQKERSEQEGSRTVFESGLDIVNVEKEEPRINFSYEYANGSRLAAVEDEAGEVEITLTNGVRSWNLKEFLPGASFVSNKFIKEHPELHAVVSEGYWGMYYIPEESWSERGRLIIVADVLSDPRHVLAVFHEMGHAALNLERTPHEAMDSNIRKEGWKGWHRAQEELSREERGSWSRALSLARQVKSECDINILEPFESFQDVQRFIYTMLSTYRYSGELGQDEGKFKKWLRSLTGNILNAEDQEFINALFDKGKLARLSGGA